ncbi:MAG: hypothetical protein R2712_06260 [Vicinamibacterales bacterium]
MMPPTLDRDAFCRELEAYLCRKNEGHLIRIVGPAFERVQAWADQGIPIKVAQAGIDRYFERYYRKGPRRRPVRIEFCEADVLDAFDDWRRAVGVSVVAADPDGGPPVEEPQPVQSRHRRSLKTALDSAMARLTVLRGSSLLGGVADEPLDAAIRTLESVRPDAEHARGAARQAVLDAAERAGRPGLRPPRSPAGRRPAALTGEARSELEPFRERMAPEAHQQARAAAVARLVRQRFGLPDFSL